MALYNQNGEIELTPEQHLSMLLDRLAQDNATAARWNARREEALARVLACQKHVHAAQVAASHTLDWIHEYARQGVVAQTVFQPKE